MHLFRVNTCILVGTHSPPGLPLADVKRHITGKSGKSTISPFKLTKVVAEKKEEKIAL